MSDEKTNAFKLGNVSKLDLNYEIYNTQILDDDSFAFETTDADNNDEICTLNLSNDISNSDASSINLKDKNQSDLEADNSKILYKANGISIGNYNVSEDGKNYIFWCKFFAKG